MLLKLISDYQRKFFFGVQYFGKLFLSAVLSHVPRLIDIKFYGYLVWHTAGSDEETVEAGDYACGACWYRHIKARGIDNLAAVIEE